ncbi:MAG: ParA family protein [Gammaproteobacteria bacterium]|nr:ParA family protein [Gammaproteobacteria bacterium]
MHKILVINSKGGCGKTTLATNLASYFVTQDLVTALLDFDPQGSSIRWLNQRPKSGASIYGVHVASRKNNTGVTRAFQMRVPPETERMIIDAPAGITGNELIDLIRHVDTIIMPVLPSSIDIHAATRFIEELLLVGKVRQKGLNVAVVANRAKKNTLTYKSLERFLKTLKLPFITTLRDTQNYVHAAERGIGIHEMWDKRTDSDKAQWRPLVRWLEDVHQVKTSRKIAR